jgi:acyl-[acyl-carrier-protein]-phospholipid O-acyltransferase/long-chain-fatty-acid--[acyl-carrier-protein] ligase
MLVLSLFFTMEMAASERDTYVALVNFFFTLPMVLFALTGGYLADKFSKRRVTIGTKSMEIGVMILATLALWQQNIPMLLGVIFLMSTQSALFGPSKYGMLPELLPARKLSWGNGVLELGTFLAVIGGMAAGPLLAEHFQGRQSSSGLTLVGLALIGLTTSLFITRLRSADPTKRFRLNFWNVLTRQLRSVRRDRVLFLAVLGNAYFWSQGILLTNLILLFGRDVLGAGVAETGYLLVSSALGVGGGCLVAGYLSGNKIEYGLIPLGAVGMSLFLAFLALAEPSFWGSAALLFAMGFASGFYIVPVNALMQHRPEARRRGAVLGAAYLLSSFAMLLATGLFYLMAVTFALSATSMLLLTALATLSATGYVVRLLPFSMFRLVLWFFVHTLYRLRVEGRENVPEKGGALLVCNHVSYVDVAFLLASTDRDVRFLMLKDYYELAWIRPFARMAAAIPISYEQKPRDMLRAFRKASEAIESGEVVCLFAEGQITRTGQLLPFKGGLERIMKGIDAPIIPVSLEGAWGSIFSFQRGRFMWKMPHHIPYPVTVSFGPALSPKTTTIEVRQAVQELQSHAFIYRRERMLPIQHSFVRTARRHPFRLAMADAKSGSLLFGALLTRTVFLARRLKGVWSGQEKVGILVPPSIAGALVNLAALLLGKVPVNLNYTASDSVMASCAKQCEIETVVTSKAFLERFPVTVPGEVIFLEDLARTPGFREMLGAFLLAWALPVQWLEKRLGVNREVGLDDLATVIFSSGSTGNPKGVMLSHYNIQANVEQISQIIPLGHRDRILGILPFFHSFGFTATLVFPCVKGLGAAYHFNPLDAKAIGALVRKYAVSFMMATPTFLQAYTRRCTPEDFGSLEFVLAGAEKLPERIAVAFEERYGIRPLEGYGCTECSPVVAVNTADYRAAGFRQIGAKRGKIGHPLPGVSIRIVDPDTWEPLPMGSAGLMLVRGPNVMQGYLGQPEKTDNAFHNGWYITGDIAAIDEDGFLTITDRLSRFSKIGGEMVPHVKVEEKLHELAGLIDQTFVVTGVPDEVKGERLVVLHTLQSEDAKETLDQLSHCDLPRLWIPKPAQFFHIDELPVLGTGKLDLRRVRQLALQLSGEAQ